MVKNGGRFWKPSGRARRRIRSGRSWVSRAKFVATYIRTLHGNGPRAGNDPGGGGVELKGDPRFAISSWSAKARTRRELKKRAEGLGLQNLIFVDQQPRAGFRSTSPPATSAWCLLRALPLFKTVLPSKIFEFLGCARPVLIGVEGEARTLVEESGGGLAFKPEDAAELATQLQALAGEPARLEEMGRRGRDYVEANFSRSALAERYLSILSELVS